jgi:hypothetical protein
MAVALLLAFVAWTPSVRTATPSVDLPALVVAAPSPPASFTRRSQGPTFSRSLSLYPASEFQDGFWGDPHRLLFEFTTLSERRRDPSFIGIAVE